MKPFHRQPHQSAPQAELLDRLRTGDDAACAEFVKDQMPRTLALAQRLLGNAADAQDAAQDAFLSFFRSLDTFRSDCSLTTWLHRITANAALMKRRAQATRKSQSIDPLLPQFDETDHRRGVRRPWSETPDQLLEHDEVRTLVRAKIDELPDDYRTVLLLRDIDELETTVVAEMLGDSPGAIKVRLHRARQALRTMLEKEWAGE